ncbi:MAG: hypothetical protein WC989_09865 [Micavibrio sp.]
MAPKRKKRSWGWRGQILLIATIMAGFVFSATAIIFAIGMIPTIVAAIVDRTEGRLRAMTIGAMNFAGCMPFAIEVFTKGNSIDIAINYIVQPRTIVVMYFAAAMGYLIDWAMTGIVSSIMIQRGRKRLKDIEKSKVEMTERWGPEVTGTIPLDEYGFAREVFPAKGEEAGQV